MSATTITLVAMLAFTSLLAAEDDLLDRVDEALTFSALQNDVRARLSGTLDLEEYNFPQPPPGLIKDAGHNLFNPRLSLFLDVQLGSGIYLFAQSRLDRGFDPTDGNAQMRMDEYALRITPWNDGRFNLQIGKSATVTGNYVPRHLSWENPFVTAPLPYENAPPLPYGPAWANRNPTSSHSVHNYQYTPLIWGPNYTSGASIFGHFGTFEYAAEIKNASLSSAPEVWDLTDRGLTHPTVSARLGYRPNETWNFGLSASEGPFLSDQAAPLLPAGDRLAEYKQFLLGQDASFAWRHWQIWAECYEARFEVPRLGNVDSVAYYLEAKYKFLPQLFGALRWNQQFYSNLPKVAIPAWENFGSDAWRIDAALAYRFTPRTQLKLQYSLEFQNRGSREFGSMIAAQFTVRF
jgi:hypothetical protein